MQCRELSLDGWMKDYDCEDLIHGYCAARDVQIEVAAAVPYGDYVAVVDDVAAAAVAVVRDELEDEEDLVDLLS